MGARPTGKVPLKTLLTFVAALAFFLPATGFVLPGTAGAAEAGTSLVDVRSGSTPDAFLLVCDGGFLFHRVDDPDANRMVVELVNVRNGIKQNEIPLESGLVSGVSVTPAPAGSQGTRVVFDLKRPCPASLHIQGDTLLVRFDTGAAPASASPGASNAPPDSPPPAAGSSAKVPGRSPGPNLAAGAAGAGAIAGQATPSRIALPMKPRSDYVIGSEDLLEISVFEQPDLNRTVRVSGDGTISIPLLGVVPVNGLTTKQAETKLQDLLGAKYLTDPQVSVFVKEAKSKKVSVVGAVEKPGTVEMLGQRTLLETISEAGGLTQQAGNELYVLRPDPSGATTRIDVDLDDLMINGNPELNIPILPGDVINIPVDRIFHVYVDGAVRNPGQVEYKSSRPLNLLQAIAAAGGLSDRASQKGIVLIRNHAGAPQEILKIDLKAVRKGKEPNLVLERGDSIYVPETFF